MRIWREGTCSSKYKPENGTCWMRTVLAEWERYLQPFEMRVISVIFSFLFEIPPEHIIWEIVCAHVTLEMSTLLSEHVAKVHISVIHLHELSPNRFCTYHLKKRVQVCGNNTLMARFKIAVTPLLTHWSYHSLALSPRHVRGNVRNYKTGHLPRGV